MTLVISGTAEKYGTKQFVFDHFVRAEGVAKQLGSLQVFITLATGELYLKWWRFPTREEKSSGAKSSIPYMVKLSEKFSLSVGAYRNTQINQTKVTHAWDRVKVVVTNERVTVVDQEEMLAYVAPVSALVHGMHDEPDYDPWKRVRVKTPA